METSTAVTLSDFQSVFTAITGQFSVSTIVAVLAGIIGLGIGAVFMWWGVRKGIRSIMSAFKKGRVSA